MGHWGWDIHSIQLCCVLPVCLAALPDHAMSSADSLSLCPTYAPALGFGGAMIALVMACVGSAYGTGKAAMGISTIGVEQPDVRRASACAPPP